MAEENYGLIQSFLIDDGQLDGLRDNEIFVLGYEFAEVTERINKILTEPLCEGTSLTIHTANKARIRNLAGNKDVFVEFEALDDCWTNVVFRKS